MTTSEQQMTEQTSPDARKNANWLMFLGILLIILGVIALGMEVSMTIVSVLFFGFIILAGGIFQLIDAFKAEGWKSVLYHVLIALLYVAAGIIMITDPLLSAVWMTMAIASMLIVVGFLRIFMGLQLRPIKGWGWTVAAGIAAIVLGGMIFAQWPDSGLWVIGLFIAIELIMQGWAMIAIAMAARASAQPAS
jgi:uncharacterized membrane protein HdeD (DUF308 family)